jgi:ubiquinone biosynthesis monooxygenase Coq7
MLMRLHKAVESFVPPPGEPRSGAAGELGTPELGEAARRHSAGLMRVNHAGEIAAQALYRGQAAVARDPKIRQQLLDAAGEEQTHLQWCEQRLAELGERPSRLDPLWYAGSYAIGAVAGLAGDKWSLGFVEETEKQVAEHLRSHLDKLPEGDTKSRAIVAEMKQDEERHGRQAAEAGAQALPRPVRDLMRAAAKIMTRSAYWI